MSLRVGTGVYRPLKSTTVPSVFPRAHQHPAPARLTITSIAGLQDSPNVSVSLLD